MLNKELLNLIKTVTKEANQNPEFAKQLKSALNPKRKSRRGRHRRTEAILDPITLAQEGEHVLRSKLEPLTLDQLKDIVAEYGMDPDKLAMKWKTSSRIIDRIVDYSVKRAKKGEVFLA